MQPQDPNNPSQAPGLGPQSDFGTPPPAGGPSQPLTPSGPGAPAPSPIPDMPPSNPGQPPVPPFSPVGPQPSVSGAQFPVTDPLAVPASNGPGKKKLVIMAVILAVVIAVGAALTVFVMGSLASIKLTEYSTGEYSIQVPAEYKKEVSGDSTNFKEDAPKKTRSEVMVYYANFPSAITSEQVGAVKDTLRTQLKTAADSLADDGQKVEDLDVSETKYHGADALLLTANVTSDGKKAGKVRLVAVVNTKQLYMVGVAAHNSDKGLQKKAETIIDSFALK